MFKEIKAMLQQPSDCGHYIYYTGHGEKNTGNWCFKDETVSLQEIIQICNDCNFEGNLVLYCDCCYIGNWCELLKLRN